MVSVATASGYGPYRFSWPSSWMAIQNWPSISIGVMVVLVMAPSWVARIERARSPDEGLLWPGAVRLPHQQVSLGVWRVFWQKQRGQQPILHFAPCLLFHRARFESPLSQRHLDAPRRAASETPKRQPAIGPDKDQQARPLVVMRGATALEITARRPPALASTTVAIISAVSRVISGLAARDQASVVY